jgi:hypothetical protein
VLTLLVGLIDLRQRKNDKVASVSRFFLEPISGGGRVLKLDWLIGTMFYS